MREITSHKVNGLNESIRIVAADQPGAGNAHHWYQVVAVVPTSIESDEKKRAALDKVSTNIVFQNGPIGEAGVNGISNEALLAIVEDRLKCFQAGPYACRENAVALTKIQEAMMWLQRRTIERTQRGVEGTSQK